MQKMSPQSVKVMPIAATCVAGSARYPAIRIIASKAMVSAVCITMPAAASRRYCGHARKAPDVLPAPECTSEGFADDSCSPCLHHRVLAGTQRRPRQSVVSKAKRTKVSPPTAVRCVSYELPSSKTPMQGMRWRAQARPGLLRAAAQPEVPPADVAEQQHQAGVRRHGVPETGRGSCRHIATTSDAPYHVVACANSIDKL